jgi:hypothetical protein
MEMACMPLFRPKFPFKGARSGNETSDWLVTEFPLEEQSKTEFDAINRYSYVKYHNSSKK